MTGMFDAAPEFDSTPALQQSPAFARALTATGHPPLILPNGTLVLRRRWGALRTHMLARSDMRDPARHLSDLRDAGVRGPVVLSPNTPCDFGKLPVIPLISPAHVATLDLTPDHDMLRAGLHQKWRNRLRHAQSHGLRVTRQNMPDDADHWMFTADIVQQAARRYRNWPIALTCAYGRENRGDAKLFCAHIGREPVAAVLVLRHGVNATYHIGHTRPSGRRLSAHSLLMWEAICWLKSKGVAHFELGLVDTEDGSGLARFKLGTGATVRPLGGTWLWW